MARAATPPPHQPENQPQHQPEHQSEPGSEAAPGGTQRRRALLKHLGRVEVEAGERRAAAMPGGERPGFGKRAGDYVAQVVDDRTNEQLADSLGATAEEIRRALARLDEGHDGVCERCGRPISAARLEAIPWATVCVACQQALVAERANPLGRLRGRR